MPTRGLVLSSPSELVAVSSPADRDVPSRNLDVRTKWAIRYVADAIERTELRPPLGIPPAALSTALALKKALERLLG